MSDFERRLAGWQPTSEGLNADAMLFAAGLAAGRRGPGRIWPTLCALLIVQIVGLGAWAISERAERLALASELGKGIPLPDALPGTADVKAPHSRYSPAPDDYFHLRRRAEQDASYYLASLQPVRVEALGQPFPQAAILRAGQWGDLLDQ